MKLKIFYDGTCPFCVSSAALLQRLDWFNQLECVDLHAQGVLAAAGIPMEAALLRIQTLSENGDVHAGIDGVQQAARRIPALWWMLPFLRLAIWLGWGQRVYDWIAKRRLLFPLPGFCALPKKETK